MSGCVKAFRQSICYTYFSEVGTFERSAVIAMSRSTNCTLTCPCGKVFSSPIYEYVNIAENPQLQYTVLAGLLNVSTCPSCSRRTVIARPLIYSDPAHNLLAYVHPRADTPEEARMLILEKLRTVYLHIVDDGCSTNIEQRIVNGQANLHGSRQVLSINSQLSTQKSQARAVPPLHIVFGLEQLNQLINVTLSQDERLGRLALSTHSCNDAERGQLLDIARKFASEMQCQIEVGEMPNEYTVWLYGSRRRIGALMRELAPRG